MKILIKVLLISFFISCKPKSDNKINNIETSDINNKIEKCEIIKEHIFSNKNSNDTFEIIYDCNNLEGPMIFQIINNEGITIYKKEFLGIQLYDYERPWYLYVTNPIRVEDFDHKKMNKHLADSLQKADLKYIKSRINSFFDEEKFIKNPLSNLDKDFINQEILKKIDNDKITVGFSYKLFEGGGFEIIGYSKKLNKTLLIADCC